MYLSMQSNPIASHLLWSHLMYLSNLSVWPNHFPVYGLKSWNWSIGGAFNMWRYTPEMASPYDHRNWQDYTMRINNFDVFAYFCHRMVYHGIPISINQSSAEPESRDDNPIHLVWQTGCNYIGCYHHAVNRSQTRQWKIGLVRITLC